MIAADVALVLLAAGKSTRFGGSKLDAMLDGLPLGLHIVRTTAAMPFRTRIAVTGRCAIDYDAEGFTAIRNGDPIGDMASSLRFGVAAAGEAAAILVVLADMPRVSMAHVQRLLDAADGPRAIIASSDDHIPRPPALFGAAWFPTLATLTGDRGARDLIQAALHVSTVPEELVDIDTRTDLARIGG